MPRQPNTSPQTRRVLEALLEPPEWHHGYDLAKRTGLKSGTLYPILIRLSEQGHLKHQWLEPEIPGRPARHTYRLTPSGHALAQTARTRPQTTLKPRTA